MSETSPIYLIEEKSRLSHSRLWQLQRAYFEQQGVRAWNTETVPSFITSNAFIAQAYAQVVYGFLQDSLPGLDGSQPVYLVELGAGSGRFAFLFLKKLAELTAVSPLPACFCYVITDFTASNLHFWQSHPAFKPFIAKGWLDFALFDTRHDQQIHLTENQQTLSAETLKNPLVVMANYVFDSIEQDAFRVENDTLYESLITLYTEQPETNPHDPAILSRLKVRFDYLPTTPDYYPDNPAYNHILHEYRTGLEDTSVSLPIGAFEVIDRLAHLANGRLLLLAGDKGYGHEDELWQHGDPVPVNHGSFSLSVNFHAIGKYLEQRGGLALHTSPRDAAFAVSAFLLGKGEFPATQRAYRSHVEHFGPVDFFALQEGVRSASKVKLTAVLSLLRLSGWDPRLFYQMSDLIADEMREANDNLKQQTRRALEQIWQHYFFIGDARDVAFEMGRVYYHMHDYANALRCYRTSLELFGDHHITFLNMGLCFRQINLLSDSLRHLQRALALKPDYELAKEWLGRVQAEMG